MKEALELVRTKRNYKGRESTLRSIRKRFKDGEMTLDKQVEFLLDNGFFMRHEINWGKVQKKGKKALAPIAHSVETIVHHTPEVECDCMESPEATNVANPKID